MNDLIDWDQFSSYNLPLTSEEDYQPEKLPDSFKWSEGDSKQVNNPVLKTSQPDIVMLGVEVESKRGNWSTGKTPRQLAIPQRSPTLYYDSIKSSLS